MFHVGLILECHSLIDELSTSHSTDLQQHAYELRALLGLGADVVECVMPLDASCEDIEASFYLYFLEILKLFIADPVIFHMYDFVPLVFSHRVPQLFTSNAGYTTFLYI